MSGEQILSFIKKDAKLFFVDRQAVVLSLGVPVLIASILGYLDTAASSNTHQKITCDFVDQDRLAVSQAVLKSLANGASIVPISVTYQTARDDVLQGKVPAAVVLPKGFGDRAAESISGGAKAQFELLVDPSHSLEGQIVEGKVIQAASSAAAQQSFGLFTSNTEGAPVEAIEIQETSNPKSAKWASAAHDFSGFGMQGLLFFAMESAVGLARERKMGIWQRLRSSPVSFLTILISRGLSSAIIALAIIGVMFGVGAALFGIRVTGSIPGFIFLVWTTAALSSSFGLLMATVGKSEGQSRGLSFFLIMVMLATGGAWFPLSQMPPAVQKMARFLPVKWAVDGFDGLTWRGLSLSFALKTCCILWIFVAVFLAISAVRFRRVWFST